MTRPFEQTHARPAPRGAERARDLGPRLAVRACGHDGTGSEHAALVTEILDLHDALAAEPTLEPGPHTDALFTRLVGLAVARRPASVVDAVLADPRLRERLPDLRARCAAGEYALERAWAHRVLAAGDPAAALAGFPYLQNYRDLTRMEFHAVAGHAPDPPRRALFVGSGPLPLSALLLARHGVAVDAVDVDHEAVVLGGALARALGDDVAVREGDVLGLGDLGGYDLVCLAALVGLAPADKAAALAHVRARMRPGAMVLARSAHSLRALLYPVLDVSVAGDDADGGLGGLDPVAVLHPHTDVVNSVVLARVPG
jgi:nicotianamine synthase